MGNENDDQVLQTFEILHSLLRETEALAALIERELLLDDGSDTKSGGAHAADHRNTHSLFRDLEWRIKTGKLGLTKMTYVLGMIVREVEFFRVMLQNSYGSMTHKQTLTPNRKRVRLEPLIEEVVDLFEYSAAAKGIEIRTHITGNPSALADRALLHRVLVNLIDNGIKYSYSSADSSMQRFVSVDCRRHSMHGDWIITVSSYGVGIDPDEISSGYLFEYGTRGKFSGDRGRSGTGIGLAEAKRIVEAHHGKLQLESNRIAGDTFLTTVKVILPAA